MNFTTSLPTSRHSLVGVMHDSRYRVTCVETNEPERTSREWKEGMDGRNGRERESELLIVNRTKESSVSSGRRADGRTGLRRWMKGVAFLAAQCVSVAN